MLTRDWSTTLVYWYNALTNRATWPGPEIYITLLTNVTPINSIKKDLQRNTIKKAGVMLETYFRSRQCLPIKNSMFTQINWRIKKKKTQNLIVWEEKSEAMNSIRNSKLFEVLVWPVKEAEVLSILHYLWIITHSHTHKHTHSSTKKIQQLLTGLLSFTSKAKYRPQETKWRISGGFVFKPMGLEIISIIITYPFNRWENWCFVA